MPDVRTIVPETVVVTACPSVGVANDAAPDRDRRVHGGRRRPSRCRSPGQAAPLDEHTPSCSAAAALPVAVHGPGAPVGSGGAVSIDTRRPTGLGRRRPRTVGARGQGAHGEEEPWNGSCLDVGSAGAATVGAGWSGSTMGRWAASTATTGRSAAGRRRRMTISMPVLRGRSTPGRIPPGACDRF